MILFSGVFWLFVIVMLMFNVPVVTLVGFVLSKKRMNEAISEKGPVAKGDLTSYSRLTGALGAVILTTFFWALGNIIIWKAFTNIDDMMKISNSVGNFFMIGAALFLPYAFNQIRNIFAPPVLVEPVADPKAQLASAHQPALAQGVITPSPRRDALITR